MNKCKVSVTEVQTRFTPTRFSVYYTKKHQKHNVSN